MPPASQQVKLKDSPGNPEYVQVDGISLRRGNDQGTDLTPDQISRLEATGAELEVGGQAQDNRNPGEPPVDQ